MWVHRCEVISVEVWSHATVPWSSIHVIYALEVIPIMLIRRKRVWTLLVVVMVALLDTFNFFFLFHDQSAESFSPQRQKIWIIFVFGLETAIIIRFFKA
jgi:hypothetical protein